MNKTNPEFEVASNWRSPC